MNYLVIQLTGTEAIFARFQKRRASLSFLGGGRQALDQTPISEFLAEIKSGGTQQEKVILSLPPASLFLRELELPIIDRRKLRDVLPLELKGETALDADEMVFDGMPLANGKVLAVWARRKDIAEQIRMLAEAGLEPEIVTTSLFHWHSLLPHGSTGTVAVTDGEAVAVYRDEKPLFFRPLQTRSADEVTRTLTVLEVGREIVVEQLLFHNGTACNDLAAARPAGLTCAPVPLHGELSATFGNTKTAIDLAGVFATARACLLGEEINFRTGDLAYTAGRERLRRKLRLSLALAAACIILLFAEAGVRYALVKRDVASLNQSIGTIYHQVFPGRKKPVDEVAELRSEIKRLGGGSAAAGTLVALNRLAEIKGDDITGVYEAEIEGGQVRIKGDARSIQAVNEFKTKAATFFTGAEVGEMKSRSDGGVSFVFRGALKEEGK